MRADGSTRADKRYGSAGRYRGRTYVAEQGAVPAARRAAVGTQDANADGAGRGGPVHHVTQAPS